MSVQVSTTGSASSLNFHVNPLQLSIDAEEVGHGHVTYVRKRNYMDSL